MSTCDVDVASFLLKLPYVKSRRVCARRFSPAMNIRFSANSGVGIPTDRLTTQGEGWPSFKPEAARRGLKPVDDKGLNSLLAHTEKHGILTIGTYGLYGFYCLKKGEGNEL